jgi:putative endopeptidase
MKMRNLAWTCLLGITAASAQAATHFGNQLGIDESIIDQATAPCQNFYQYACGNWLAHAEIPADLPAWDRSFMAIREKNRLTLREILESQPKSKMGKFYAACMNESAIDQNSLTELNAELKKIDALDLKANTPVAPAAGEPANKTNGKVEEQAAAVRFASLLADLHLKGVNALFDFGEQQDFKDATQVIGVVDQAGLSLPDRDYYLKDEAKTLEVRSLFQKYAQNILIMLGSSEDSAKDDVQKIMKFETALAKNSMSRTDRRNPFNIYHRIERKGLKEKAPQVNWDEYFRRTGVAPAEALNVSSPEYFSALNDLLTQTPVADLKIYLKWHLTSSVLSALPQKFVEENFRFVSQALSGQKKLEDRWKRCVRAVDAHMGFALGKVFVEKKYGADGKAVTQSMIQNVEKAFEGELSDLAWMDAPTQEQARKKLHTIVNKVGYPEVWRNYQALEVNSKSYLQTLLNSAEFNSRYELNKIGKPLDRKEWQMSPPTVNAYYDSSLNEMVFPAGILQPPFFNKESRAEANYGAIGVVMGHELTHGFDDQGRQYDELGNLKDWWTPAVGKAFDAKAECVAKEYDGFEPLPGLHLNGKLTLGENIADHGGMRIAYRAWLEANEGKEKAGPKKSQFVSKFTADQRFFLAFAQSWCSKKQEQLARMLVKTDPHAPSQFRVNGTLSQFSKFGEAFHCEAGTPMAPKDRCEIW